MVLEGATLCTGMHRSGREVSKSATIPLYAPRIHPLRREDRGRSLLVAYALVLSLPLICMLGSAGQHEGLLWEIETVEAGRDVGRYTSIAIDSHGTPHVLYVDRSSDSVKYAVRQPGGWSIQIVDSLGGFTDGANLVLDNGGRPHVSYFSEVRRALLYAVRAGSAWERNVVDTPVNHGVHGLSVDAQGNAHLAYGYLNTRLRYARLEGTSWRIETADNETLGADHISLALDRSGLPHITYQGYATLRYAFWDGRQWNLEVVDPSEGVGLYARIAIDTVGTVHVAYRDEIGEDLIHGRRSAGLWSLERVDRDGDAGWDIGLSVGPGNEVQVSYYERLKSELRYARLSSETWWVDVVDTEGVVGWDTAVAVDRDGNPHISYYDWTRGLLKYAFGRFEFAIRTLPPSEVTPTSAVLRGDLLSLGTFPVAAVSFEWRPTGESDWRLTSARMRTSANVFDSTLADLSPGQEYEVRARGDADGTTAWGTVLAFRTPVPPDKVGTQRFLLLTGTVLGTLATLVVLWMILGALRWRRKGDGENR